MCVCVCGLNVAFRYDPYFFKTKCTSILWNRPDSVTTVQIHMYVLKLHLRNLHQVRTWQGEKGLHWGMLGWARPTQIRRIRVGLMAYNRCKVKQGGGGCLIWDDWIYGKTASKVLLLHTIMRQKSQGCVCPSTTFMSSSWLREKPVEKCFCQKWIWLLQVHIPPSNPAAPPLMHYSCPKPSVSSIANMSFSFSCS